jgi:hypothetical protein
MTRKKRRKAYAWTTPKSTIATAPDTNAVIKIRLRE